MQKNSGTTSRLGVVLLAAGAGSRMGQIKPLVKWQNSTFVERLLAQVTPLSLPVAVILGAHNRQIQDALLQHFDASARFQILTNLDWEDGMSSSIRLGVSHFHHFQAVMFIAVDQVLIETEHLVNMISKWQQNKTQIHCAAYQQTFGIPAIFPAQFFPELLSLSGEQGAKRIIAKSSTRTLIDMPVAAIDIDTPQQLEHLTNEFANNSLDSPLTTLINKDPTV
jgi:molybdenum cofactor cytidylyltransferase